MKALLHKLILATLLWASVMPGFAQFIDPFGPTTDWLILRLSSTNQSDYFDDQQTGVKEADIVGTSNTPAFYFRFETTGGTNATNGLMAFRVRLARQDNPPGYDGVFLVGIDGNSDGKIDIFTGVDNSGGSDAIRVWKAGTGLNISPSTTTIDNTPLNSYSPTVSNYSWMPVTTTNDPGVLTTDVDGDGRNDYFLTFVVPFEAVVGAFNSVGISNVVATNPLAYLGLTATQPNAFNQDLLGLPGGLNSTNSFLSTGTYTPPSPPFNLAPTNLVLSPTSVAENQPPGTTVGTFTTFDPNTGNTFTYALVSGPGDTDNALFSITNNVLLTAASFNFEATNSFTIRVSTTDQGGLSYTNTFIITITDVNERPVLSLAIPDQSGTYGSPFSYTFPAGTFTDEDFGQTLGYAATNLPPGITFDGSTRTFSGTPTASGSFTVTVTATDDGSPPLATNDTFLIIVAPAPLLVAADDKFRLVGETNPPLTYSFFGFVLGDTTNALTGAPSLSTTATTNSPPGTYPITISAGTLAAANYSFSFSNGVLTVGAGNTPPVASNLNFNVTEDIATLLTLTGSDDDGHPLTFILLTGPTNGTLGTLNPVTGEVTYSPATNYFGPDSFTFYVSDGFTNSAPATVTINVLPANDAPMLALAVPDQNGTYGSAFSYTFPTNTFTDVDPGQTLTFTATNLPPGITFDGGTRTFSGTPTQAGTFTITLTATDDGSPALSATDTFDLVVAPANLNVTAQDATRGYGEPNPVFSYLLSGFVLGDTTNVVSGAPDLSTPATTNSPVGTYPINVAQGTLAASNYSFTLIPGTLSVTGAVPLITWNPVGPIVYGTPLGSNQLNATADTPGSFTYTPGEGTITNAGTNLLVVVFTPTDTNYAAVTSSVPFLILKAPLIVTADNQSAPVGGPFPPFTVSYSGFFSNETPAVLDTPPTATTTATTNSPPGLYPITPGGGADDNYTFTYVDGTLAIGTLTPALTIVRQIDGFTTFNPQTSLFEQTVLVSNTTAATITAFRLVVSGLPATVQLYNAHGTNGAGHPYVDLAGPLAPGDAMTVLLEYWSEGRQPFAAPTVSVEVLAFLPPTPPPSGTVTAIGNAYMAANGRFYLEWNSEVGKTYYVQYADNPLGPWKTVLSPVAGTGFRIVWIDDGPPKTESPGSSSRFYRLIVQ